MVFSSFAREGAPGRRVGPEQKEGRAEGQRRPPRDPATGGPMHATEFLGTYIYRQGIRQSHLGYAAALSVILLVLAVAGAFLTNKANAKEG